FQKEHDRAEAIDLQPEDDPQTPFRDYAAKLKSQKSLRKKSAASWDWALGHACDFVVNDLGTRFGDVPVAGIKRAFVKALLVQKRLTEGYAPDSVRLIHTYVHQVFEVALSEELIAVNPADHLPEHIRGLMAREEHPDEEKPFAQAEATKFLATAK